MINILLSFVIAGLKRQQLLQLIHAYQLKVQVITSVLQTIGCIKPIVLLGMKLGLGLAGIWTAFAMDECLRAIIFWARWKSGRWKNLQTV